MYKYILSIVIPHYNSYSSLAESLNKIIKLNPVNTEIIIVDDCSTDGSFEKINNFVSRIITNASIKVIATKNNGGPGAARNFGINIASGEYITFLDADDYFDNEFFSCFYDASKTSPDCITFDYYYVNRHKIVNKSIFYNRLKEEFIDPKTAMVLIRGSAWGKIYKKSIIDNNNIKFPDLYRNEDIPFTRIVISKCQTIKYINKPLYYYIDNENSLTHNDYYFSQKNSIIAFEYMTKYVDEDFSEELEGIYIHDIIYQKAISSILSMEKEEWVNYVTGFSKKFPEYIHNKYLKLFGFVYKMLIFYINNKLYYPIRLLIQIKRGIQ